uniref:Phytocyanin domain-containing protein n=1 Tax=Ananas comosus var. bracteatus TaxID=296719 RepID=A0A6V7PHZ0_ANACO|nr:unnamed protein product [Ananas comosus var. bracteatus]
MGFYCTVVVVTALLLLSISAKLPVVVVVAKDYRVGGTDGWTFGPDFLQWSEQYNFTVGDVLIFNYVKGQHNTYQVTEDAYKACDGGETIPPLRVYVSGNDVVNLTRAASYYFLCNIKGHCLGGMKLNITVAANATPTPTPSGGNTLPPPPPSPPLPPESRGNRGAMLGKWWWGCAALVFGIFTSLY